MGFGNWTAVALRMPVLVLALAGCPKRGPSGVEALEVAIRAADTAWEGRTEDLAPVRQALVAAQAIDAESPEVQWRFARLEIGEGLMAADALQRIASFSRARQHGWNCVLGDPVVRTLSLEVGVEQALRRTKPDRQACVTWAYLAWARWYGDFGASAGALDRPRFTAIDKVAGTYVGVGDRERVTWATALVQAAEGDPDGLSVVEDPIARVDELRFGHQGADVGRIEQLALRAPEARAYRRWVVRR